MSSWEILGKSSNMFQFSHSAVQDVVPKRALISNVQITRRYKCDSKSTRNVERHSSLKAQPFSAAGCIPRRGKYSGDWKMQMFTTCEENECLWIEAGIAETLAWGEKEGNFDCANIFQFHPSLPQKGEQMIAMYPLLL